MIITITDFDIYLLRSMGVTPEPIWNCCQPSPRRRRLSAAEVKTLVERAQTLPEDYRPLLGEGWDA